MDHWPLHLPALSPSETLYSWCATFHRRSFSGNALATSRQLFGEIIHQLFRAAALAVDVLAYEASLFHLINPVSNLLISANRRANAITADHHRLFLRQDFLDEFKNRRQVLVLGLGEIEVFFSRPPGG